MITKERRAELTAQFGKTANDSGSAEVQVAVLTERINNLKSHFDKHIHDFHSNRGLLKMIGQRKKLLKYVRGNSEESYKKLIAALGLRK